MLMTLHHVASFVIQSKRKLQQVELYLTKGDPIAGNRQVRTTVIIKILSITFI
jgi:hypothetical protein